MKKLLFFLKIETNFFSLSFFLIKRISMTFCVCDRNKIIFLSKIKIIDLLLEIKNILFFFEVKLITIFKNTKSKMILYQKQNDYLNFRENNFFSS